MLMYGALKAGDLGEARKVGLLNCIECGVCAFTCPAHIRLAQWFHAGKLALRGYGAAPPANSQKLSRQGPRQRPHTIRLENTTALMGSVLIALTPAAAFGVALFGIQALLNIAVSIGSAVAGEALFRRVTGQDARLKDLSACVTGLLLALVIPPSTPLWMTALGSLFAIIVAKEFFGGLGANLFNPALAGRAFMLISFPGAMLTWLKPAASGSLFRPDGMTSPTPLGIVNGGGTVEGLPGFSDKFEVYKELFLGFRGGCVGETSILLILGGAVFLLVTKVIDWRAPMAMLATSVIGSVVFGIDPLFTLLNGGLVFGAFFMATDYTSAPVTEAGKLIFGAGAGIMVVILRKFGDYPEGVMFSILLMNALAPFLDRILYNKTRGIKDSITMAAAIVIITILACAGVTFAQKAIAQVAETIMRKKTEAAQKLLFPAAEFETITGQIKSSNPAVVFAGEYAAMRNGEVVGVIINSSSRGYSAPITALVGVSAEGTITGVRIMKNIDTPGIGTKVSDPAFFIDGRAKTKTFYGQFNGMSANNTIALRKDGGDVVAVTMATISSRAVALLVSEALEAGFLWLSENGAAK
jgi:electron transport complex protein RnfD